MAAKPLVLYECDDMVALASEEVAIRALIDHEIDTYDPYEGEVLVWNGSAASARSATTPADWSSSTRRSRGSPRSTATRAVFDARELTRRARSTSSCAGCSTR